MSAYTMIMIMSGCSRGILRNKTVISFRLPHLSAKILSTTRGLYPQRKWNSSRQNTSRLYSTSIPSKWMVRLIISCCSLDSSRLNSNILFWIHSWWFNVKDSINIIRCLICRYGFFITTTMTECRKYLPWLMRRYIFHSVQYKEVHITMCHMVPNRYWSHDHHPNYINEN